MVLILPALIGVVVLLMVEVDGKDMVEEVAVAGKPLVEQDLVLIQHRVVLEAVASLLFVMKLILHLELQRQLVGK